MRRTAISGEVSRGANETHAGRFALRASLCPLLRGGCLSGGRFALHCATAHFNCNYLPSNPFGNGWGDCIANESPSTAVGSALI